MPLQVVEAVASSGRYTRTHAAQLGTLVHLKNLIYKHSIIVLIFQGTQRKAYKYIRLVLAAGIEPAKPQQAKKGADCAPCLIGAGGAVPTDRQKWRFVLGRSDRLLFMLLL